MELLYKDATDTISPKRIVREVSSRGVAKRGHGKEIK